MNFIHIHYQIGNSSPLSNPPKEGTKPVECNYGQNMIGDGFCDDFLNIHACWFDLGDCCDGDGVAHSYCKECTCNMPTIAILPSNTEVTTLPGFTFGTEIAACIALGDIDPSLLGDGHCDDIFNHDDCVFDNGDCCLDPISADYCTTCACLENIPRKIINHYPIL